MTTPNSEIRFRRVLLLVVAAGAAVAVLAGLARLGVGLPLGVARAGSHGPLFVVGVFSAVIALERAVALGRRWAYLAPVLGVVSILALLAGSRGLEAWLAVATALALTVVNAAIVRRQPTDFTLLMALASLLLAAGNLARALEAAPTGPVVAWMGFFVLTITAERLELSRLAAVPAWAKHLLVALAFALAVLIAAGLATGEPASIPIGLLLVAIGLWQLRFDLARRTLGQVGLPRYAAVGILLGSGWLVVAGALLAWHGLPPAGPTYDAVVHAVMIGFVLSMVFVHAPIILPAVTRLELPFHPILYLPLGVLHLGLAVRLLGDLAGQAELRRLGGVANALALLLFAASVIGLRLRWRAQD